MVAVSEPHRLQTGSEGLGHLADRVSVQGHPSGARGRAGGKCAPPKRAGKGQAAPAMSRAEAGVAHASWASGGGGRRAGWAALGTRVRCAWTVTVHGRPRAVGRSTARIGTGEIAISSILGNGEIAISSILCTGEIAISSLLARQLESAPVATLRRHPGVRRYLWRKSCDFYGPALLVWCEPRRNRCAIRDRVHVLLTRRVRSHGRHGVRGGRMDLSFRSTGRTHYNSRGGGKSAQKRKRVGPVASYTTLQRGSHPAHPTQIPMLGRPAWTDRVADGSGRRTTVL